MSVRKNKKTGKRDADYRAFRVPQKTFDKKKDADKYHAKAKAEFAEGTYTPASQTTTVEEACRAYLRSYDEKFADDIIGRGYRVALGLLAISTSFRASAAYC